MASKTAGNGAVLQNGLSLPNGFNLGNGTTLTNGINLSNGAGTANGMNIPNGTVSPPSGSDLEKWIDVDPTTRKRTLKYMVECALPSTKSVKLTYKGSSETYTGFLNLGPSWAISPGTMTTTEQEKVSACLLSRVNANGASVMIALIGPSTLGTGWNTLTDADLASYPFQEAGFAGNLFVYPPKVFVCGGGAFSFVDPVTHAPTMYNARVCPGTGTTSSCWNRGTAQTGPIWECLGSCGGIIKFDTDCNGTTANCTQLDAHSPNWQTYFSSCWDANNSRTWNNLITSYIMQYDFGHACSGNWQCRSGNCTNGSCN